MYTQKVKKAMFATVYVRLRTENTSASINTVMTCSYQTTEYLINEGVNNVTKNYKET
jgi:hypothetical protein